MSAEYGNDSQVIEHYLSYGNTLPPVGELDAILSAIKDSEHEAAWLVAADVCIDRAMHTESAGAAVDGSDDYIHTADKLLTRVVDAKHLVKAACLRQAQLPMWRGASRGDTMVPDYDRLLDAAEQALAIEPSDRESPNQDLSAFTPVLLGARAIAWSNSSVVNHWHARTALLRERAAGSDVAFFGHQARYDYTIPPVRLSLGRPDSRQTPGTAPTLQVFTKTEAEDLLDACFNEYETRANEQADGVDKSNLTVDPTLQLRYHIISSRLETARLKGFAY